MTTDEHLTARRLAERGLRAQQRGDVADAEQSLDQALALDPDAVAEILRETGADTAPDSRDVRADVTSTPPDGFRQSPE